MKIIHTSDWHLGQQLYNYDRQEEFADMLRQVSDLVEAEQPDALLICGDVFHTALPPVGAQRLFADTMAALHRRCPNTAVVVTAGNHDSASRHEIFATPWRELGVTVVGTVGETDDDLNRLIVRLPSGYVAAVPWVSGRMMPENLFGRLLDKIESENTQGLPVVVMAHAAVTGCDTTGHASDARIIGGLDCLDAADFGLGYDYVALGHIHKPQVIAGTDGRMRYSGTPLAISFDETYEHSVTVADIIAHGAGVQVRETVVRQPRPLVTLPPCGAVALPEALKLLKAFPADSPAYIRLNVLADGQLPPDADHLARREAEDKECRFCLVNAVRPEHRSAAARHTLTVEEFRQMEPIEIVSRFAEDAGEPLTDDMRALFEEVVESLNQNP